VLRVLALQPDQVPVGDPAIHHVTHCSPCFAEIQALRDRHKKAS
jgi:hypothetical protein